MKKILYFGFGLLLCSAMTSCFNDDDDADKQWKAENEAYVANMGEKTEGGVKYFEKISPVWSPGNYVLMHWHNDRSLTAGNMQPMDNSTVDITYSLTLMDRTKIADSFSSTTYGDSIYRSMPKNNIVGMWTAMTNMHVGDTVTCIIPYQSGYGSAINGEVPAFSTLIYEIKMKAVTAYEVP